MSVLVPLLLAAAPVPKTESAAAWVARNFGPAVDLDNDCTFRRDGAALAIDVPAAPHVLLPRGGRANAPRTARPVAGDFVATVKVRLQPTGGAVPRETEFMAGLVARSDAQHGAALWLSWQPWPGGPVPAKRFQAANWYTGGTTVSGWADPNDPDRPHRPVWLRLTRTGTTVRFVHGTDGPGGIKWQADDPRPHPVALGTQVEVGVFAGQTVGTGFTAAFEEFRVEPLAAEGRR